MSDLAGKIALVTGAASGIGAAVTARLQSAGAHVYAADLKPPPISGPDSRTHALKLDVREEADWIATVETILANYGRLDILMTAAGFSCGGTVLTTSLEDWDAVFRANVGGTWLWARAAVPQMQRQKSGSIITLASQLAIAGGRATAPTSPPRARARRARPTS